MNTIATGSLCFALILGLVTSAAAAPAPRARAKTDKAPEPLPTPVKPIKPAPKLELNTATSTQLQNTLGLGPVLAQRVIDNRPYASLEDLRKTGLSPSMIAKIQPLVLIAGKPAVSKVAPPVAGKPPRPTPPGTKLDLNSAMLSDIQNLPGIGFALAPRVLAGRPYSTADDLLRIGVPSSTVERIRPLVYFGPEPPRGN